MPGSLAFVLLATLACSPITSASEATTAAPEDTVTTCREICEFACWNTEDEMCFPGDLTEFQCYQIYGHREWRDDKGCSCRSICGDEEDPGPPKRDGGFEEEISNVFSIPAFIVLFRESLEVVLVLVIILQFLQKSQANGTITAEQHTKFRREVYIGAGVGFLACIGLGVGFLALLAFALQDVKGDAQLVLEGILLLITSAILSFMALNFYKMMYAKEAHERKMTAQIAQAVKNSLATGQDTSFAKKHTFLMFAFMTGLREGLESILFLAAVVVDAKDLTSLPLPIITAIILARVCGYCFFKGTNKVRVEYFMKGSSILLMFIAAGFFSVGMHMWQELDVFGTWEPKRLRPWQNQAVFNASECCNDKTNRFWVFMRAMLGWQDQPTPIEFFAWGFYWVITFTFGAFMLRRVKRQLAEMQERWREADEKAALEQMEGSNNEASGHAGSTGVEAESEVAPAGQTLS